MSELNLSELKFTEIDIKNFVNSSLDVEEGSVLFINHDDKDKLDKYVDESLKKKVKLVITSLNCSSNDDKVIKAKNYMKFFLIHTITYVMTMNQKVLWHYRNKWENNNRSLS